MFPLVAPLLMSVVFADEPAKSETKQASVEVVFVLDTTGSMGGLIQAAKDKIWAISNSLVKTKPAPSLKIGLIGYRDRGDAYVTKIVSMSDDLDAVYRELIAFEASGGGDGPESVNQSLNEAVTKFPWSKEPSTYRVIFLVGDCPPHMDYTDDVKYAETCQIAAKTGIVINTIQCGQDSATEPIWRDIASKAEGKYFRVEQDGNAIVAATPFDEQLSKLAVDLDATCFYYGSAEMKQSQLDRKRAGQSIERVASPSAVAQRAVFNASEAGVANLVGKSELIDDVSTGRVKLSAIPKEELPATLQNLPKDQQEKFVQKNKQERERIQKEIADLGRKRQAFLEALAAKSQTPVLEQVIFESVREQAKRVGLNYDKGPSY
ncbi:VWA domain-containing protein [bacterium]|nr:VWA domain-containing protein [bacterium]